MCNRACLQFVKDRLVPDEVSGKRVLEVGSMDVNGSVRYMVSALKPSEYIGVDIVPGGGVDQLLDAGKLVSTFGEESFDAVFSTEMLEHVRDWRLVITNLKQVLRAGGVLYLTTRSEGFPYHAWPEDHWRYSVKDMTMIFSDMEALEVISDPSEPGVFVKARKPVNFVERDLSGIELHAV